MSFLTIDRLMKDVPPGIAAFSIGSLDGKDRVALLAKERSDIIRRLATPILVPIRSGAIPIGNVLLVVVMFRLGEGREQLFETHWNYYNENGSEVFALMAEQTTIPIIIYGDSGGQERHIMVSNYIQPFFERMIITMESIRPWSMEEFDQAKLVVYERWPTPEVMWEALRHTTGPNEIIA